MTSVIKLDVTLIYTCAQMEVKTLTLKITGAQVLKQNMISLNLKMPGSDIEITGLSASTLFTAVGLEELHDLPTVYAMPMPTAVSYAASYYAWI